VALAHLKKRCEAAESEAARASDAARAAAAEREAESKAGFKAQADAEEAKFAAEQAAEAARRAEATETDLQVSLYFTKRASVAKSSEARPMLCFPHSDSFSFLFLLPILLRTLGPARRARRRQSAGGGPRALFRTATGGAKAEHGAAGAQQRRGSAER
jgi:hypothetical protein